jgi:hypothetical protein
MKRQLVFDGGALRSCSLGQFGASLIVDFHNVEQTAHQNLRARIGNRSDIALCRTQGVMLGQQTARLFDGVGYGGILCSFTGCVPGQGRGNEGQYQTDGTDAQSRLLVEVIHDSERCKKVITVFRFSAWD